MSDVQGERITIDDGLGQVNLGELTPTSWWTLNDFTYLTDAGQRIVIPAGFATDGCSSPLRLALRTWGGHYSTAALIHDFLYAQLDKGTPDPAAPKRVDADLIFLEVMKKTGVDPFVRIGMFMAVRLFGAEMFKWIGVRS